VSSTLYKESKSLKFVFNQQTPQGSYSDPSNIVAGFSFSYSDLTSFSFNDTINQQFNVRPAAHLPMI
jgi:hypothetical protein